KAIICLALSLFLILPPPSSTLFPYTTLFRSPIKGTKFSEPTHNCASGLDAILTASTGGREFPQLNFFYNTQLKRHTVISLSAFRSEEHTSELQSRENLVCRLLLEKKNKTINK